MPQKIDIHGIFLDPETITDLSMVKRDCVMYPVFHEVPGSKSVFGRYGSSQKHIVQFDCHQPYGIVLAKTEQPDPSSYVVTYKEAVIERLFKGIGQQGKNIAGHITEMLKIDTSGDRQLRILKTGRRVEQISLREIPAKVKLLSGQWVDVFKNNPEYDFQGGTPYATTDVASGSLMICTTEQIYVLYGAGVDASNEEVTDSYHRLIEIYNQIQIRRDAALEEKKNKPKLQLPQINIQLPNISFPKLEKPQIHFQSPITFGKKKKETEPEALLTSDIRDKEENNV